MLKVFVGLSVLSTYTLMVMGNVVTTTGSGLACPDWPLCYGTVIPPLEMQVWFEWSHRLLGALTGFLILTSAVMAWRTTTGAARWLTISALGLLVVGVIFGGVIVLIEAPLLKGFLHLAIISFHIVLATIIFTLMILAFRLLTKSAKIEAKDTSPVFPALFALVFLQVMIGILVRYGQATLACPDFPLCRGMLFPDLVDFKLTIHFLHRLTALTIFLAVTGFLIYCVKTGKDVLYASITFILVIIQGTFGAYVVWTSMFLPFIILHGATGFALLGWLAYRAAPYILTKGKAFDGSESPAGPEGVAA